MKAEDIPACVDLVANHPAVGHRYGSEIDLLSQAWSKVLQLEARVTVAFFDNDGSRVSLCLFGMTVFVSDDFVREMKTAPLFWVGPELARRVAGGRSPILSDGELRKANSVGGLNLVVWGGLTKPGYETNQELQRQMMRSFIEDHRGYLLKEIFSEQMESPDRLDFTLKTGGRLWDPVTRAYVANPEVNLEETVGRPHIVGTTRELEQAPGNWSASWVGHLFDYRPPRLGLSRSEQRLLSYALSGATDEHMAEAMGVSLPTVKKRWISIYQRMEDSVPALVSDTRADIQAASRGREKRRGLLSYLREHPEELRPVLKKLIVAPKPISVR